MATNKTLTPTNVTISIPAIGDLPDASVFSNCVDKSADAVNAVFSSLAGLAKNQAEGINNVDLNDYRTPGVYYFASGCTNAPATYFMCIVIGRNDFAIQIGIAAGSKNVLRFRVYVNNAWDSWRTLQGT